MIAYKTFGNINHPKMLFLHGFMGNLNDWNSIINHFSKSYFCISIDLPGHGSSINGSDTNFFEKMNELYSLYKPEVILGYSMGGRLLLESLLLHSDYCPNFLILESVNPGIKDQTLKIERMNKDQDLFKNIKKEDPSSFFKKWLSMPIFGNLKNHHSIKELINQRSEDFQSMKSSWQKSINTWGPGSRLNLWEKMANLKSKILYIAGEEDEKYSKVALELETNSNLKIQIIPESGHNIHFQQKDSYIKTVDHFLRH